LNAARNAATDAGELKMLDAIGRLDRIVQKSVSSLRYADYGFSGLFDQLKIGQAELDQIYAYDAGLVDDVVVLADSLRKISGTVPEIATLVTLAGTAEQLDLKVARRRELFEAPKP
jgi:hypothetical protein